MGVNKDRVDPKFEALFVAEFSRCERVARRIVWDAGRAEELASEAFTRAWARWWRVRGGNPGAWVMKVTVNLAIDAARRGVVVPDDLAAVPFEDLVATHVTLAEALRTLPARQRAESITAFGLVSINSTDFPSSTTSTSTSFAATRSLTMRSHRQSSGSAPPDFRPAQRTSDSDRRNHRVGAV